MHAGWHAGSEAGSVTDSSLAGACFDLLDIPVVPHQPTALVQINDGSLPCVQLTHVV